MVCEEDILPLIVPSNETARIQEAHILIGHVICDWIEDSIAKTGTDLEIQHET